MTLLACINMSPTAAVIRYVAALDDGAVSQPFGWRLDSLPDAVELTFIKCSRLAVDPPVLFVCVYV